MTGEWIDEIIEKYGIIDVLPLDVSEVVGMSRIPLTDLLISETTNLERLIKAEASGSRFILTPTDLSKPPFNMPPPVEVSTDCVPLYLFSLNDLRRSCRCA